VTAAAAAWASLAFSTAVTVLLLLALSPPQPSARLGEPLAAAVGLAAGGALAWALRALGAAGSRPALRGSLAQFGLLAVFAANEEVMWRRVVLGELLRGGPAAALAASTIVFAVAHRRRPGLHVVTGAAFGALYLGTGALAASIAGHWAYNAMLAVGRRPQLGGMPQ
jgi:membrane protease YdiL (CAAX protease family)